MAADVSVYSMLRQAPPPEGPLDQYGKLISLKSMLGQNDLQDLQRTKLSRDLQEEEAVRQLYAGATPEQMSASDFLQRVMGASPTRGIQLQKTQLENEKTKAELAKSRLEGHLSAARQMRDMAAQATSDADMPRLKEFATRWMGPEAAATIPDTFSPDWQKNFVMTGDKLIERMTPKFEKAGDRFVDVNPKTNPGIATTKVGVTPDAMLTDKRVREMQSLAGLDTPDGQRQLDYWANVVRKGGTLPPGLARGASGSAFVKEVTRRVAMGDVSPEEMMANQAGFQGEKAGQRTLGTRTANIEMAATEAASLADLAKQASAKVDRTQYKAFNDVMQAGQRATSSPELRAFTASNTSLINAYARAINPQGVGTVADKEHAREMLSTAFSKGDYEAAIDQLLQEITAARRSPGTVKQEMRDRFTGKAPAAGADAAAPAAPGGIRFLGWDK